MDNDISNPIPLQPFMENLSGDPSMADVLKTLNQIKSSKAAGPDGIQAEILKDDCPILTCDLLLLTRSDNMRIYHLILEML